MSFTEDQYYKPSKEEIAAAIKAKEEEEKIQRAILAEKDRNRLFNQHMSKMDAVVKDKIRECESAKSKMLVGLLAIYGSLDKIPTGALTMLKFEERNEENE
mgnify:CR=1 FL=1